MLAYLALSLLFLPLIFVLALAVYIGVIRELLRYLGRK